MGNILCKESPRRVYVKSPVNGNRNTTSSIYGQQHIHPNSLTNIDSASPKPFNPKANFFHSTPNLNNGQTKSTVSLDARIFDNGSYRTPPIAPPRKKRSTLKKGSTLPTTLENGTVRNGFKDVFTNNVGASRVLTYDDIESTEKHQNLVQTRADVEEHKDTTLERKLKIGNKKSDKFFGESLSDHLSDEHIDEPIKASKDEVDRSSTSEKKLFFLMNMLDSDQEEILKYSGIQPVEEPMFVAKKKEIKRHICDDDDHMHAKFHDHEKETCDHVVPPPKPDRDFSKYIETSIEIAPEKVERVSAQARTRRQISRESLPTPPDTPKRRSGASSLPGTPTITIENIDFNTPNDNEKLEKIEEVKKIEAKKVESNKVIDNQKENEEKAMKRPPSLNISKAAQIEQIIEDDACDTPQTPILHPNIVDQMMKKAYGMHNYHPEDNEHNHDDGSNLCAPTSKLSIRKISVGRKISSESAPSLDGDSLGRSCNELRSPDLVRQGMDSPRTPPKSPMLSAKILNAASMNDIIEEIYSKNSEIMQEFQSYLEASIEKEAVIDVAEEKQFLEKRGLVDNEFVSPEPPKMSENEDENEDTHSFSDSFESTDTEQETITEMSKIPSKFTKYSGRRRESIEDVDGWFNNHLDLEEKKSQLTNSRERTTSGTTYDLQKVFPFGRTINNRRESLSDEFFVDLPQPVGKLLIPLSETESNSEDERDEKAKNLKEQSPDHSTLLKFFDKEAKEIK